MTTNRLRLIYGFIIIVLGLAFALILAVQDAKGVAGRIEWRCYVEPVITEVDGYWLVDCAQGNEVTLDGFDLVPPTRAPGTPSMELPQEPYPGLPDEEYPYPELPDSGSCFWRWLRGLECVE